MLEKLERPDSARDAELVRSLGERVAELAAHVEWCQVRGRWWSTGDMLFIFRRSSIAAEERLLRL